MRGRSLLSSDLRCLSSLACLNQGDILEYTTLAFKVSLQFLSSMISDEGPRVDIGMSDIPPMKGDSDECASTMTSTVL